MSADRSSPPCYASEVDPGYMGYANNNEIITALQELLEAERAGARVALVSRSESEASDMKNLMEAIHADESRWCAMLSREIKRLQAEPSQICGDFYEKAVAISDMHQRLVFLNRGQGWVVRKLNALLPRVKDDALHHALLEMRDNHKANIAAVEGVTGI